MCTINSLGKNRQLFSLASSLRTVLVLLILANSQDSSGALIHHDASIAVTVTAPYEQLTIQISRPGICDTLVDIPSATYNTPCPGPLTFTTWSVFNTLNTNGGTMYFTTGVFWVYYSISDNCSMTGIDSMLVHVYDANSPHVICNPQMTMNLPSTGFLDAPAWIFDAGSTDSCGHVYFKVKRMFSTVGYTCVNSGNPFNAFDDQVRFCCQDVDSTSIMIILRVYDVPPGFGPVNDTIHQGHFVDCMVEAIIKDKIPPDIDCPDNLTLNCGFDFDSLIATIPDPFIQDNCISFSLESELINNLDACGSGSLSRVFIATDRYGQVSSCSQVITVNRVNTFNGLDTSQLKWPISKTVFACRIDLDTIEAGLPIIREDACANVQSTHHDDVYDFDRGGVCAKILRYWEVIDWCKYNPGLLPNPNIPANGYYSYVQEIKVMDTLAPVIVGFNDTIIAIQSPACQAEFVILPSVSANDCGSMANISFSFEADINSDGHIDVSGTGPNASGLYPIGRHLLKFYAYDSCHNTGTAEFILEIVDNKPPNVNAIYGLSSSLTLMQAGPMVSIHAKLFNAKSTDNCTPTDEIRFSFSKDINDTLRVFNCDSLGLRIINLVAWDENANSSQVSTFIVIDDVYNLCPSSLKTVEVGGNIFNPSNQAIRDVGVVLTYDNFKSQAQTDQNGFFNYKNVPQNKRVNLTANYNQNFSGGISTADIIKIQRHILGIEKFKTPYESLAADVDLNKSISSRDLLLLRKLILGQITELPNQDSYLFINKDYVFNDPLNPFNELELSKWIEIETNEKVNNKNLMGIKLGDINYSYKPGIFNSVYDNQSILEYRLTDSGSIEIYSPVDLNAIGIQFEIQSKDLCLNSFKDITSSLEFWSDANYKYDDNSLRISYSDQKSFGLIATKPIISIQLSESIRDCQPSIEFNENFENEYYNEVQVIGLKKMVRAKSTLKDPIENVKVFPNPFSDILTINVHASDESILEVKLFSPESKILINKEYHIHKGENTMLINRSELPGNGIFFLNLQNDQYSKVLKIIQD